MRPEKPRDIPHYTLNRCSTPGFFVKRLFDDSLHMAKDHPHRDDYHMVVFITEGTAKGLIDFEEITISAGEAIIISPSQVHSPLYTACKVDGWIAAIASEHFTPDEIEMATAYSINISPIQLTPDMADDMARLFNIISRHAGCAPIALPLVMSIKNMALFSACAANGGNNDRYMRIALKLKELIATRLNEEKSPSAYASSLNISEGYLNEAIKAVTGKSVSNFIRNQVVLIAKRQLIYTSLSAQEIAYSLGYDDYAYFSKLFKKETGLSPTLYRKTMNSTNFS